MNCTFRTTRRPQFSVTPRLFPQTHWSQVYAATGKGGGAAGATDSAAAAALESLCRAYWNPLYKTSLTATHGNMDYPGMAARLGATTGATRVAVHRLRKRFR